MTTVTQIPAAQQNLESRTVQVERAYLSIVEQLIELHKTFKEPHFRKFAQLTDYYSSAPEFISRFINVSLSADKSTIFYGKSANATYEVGKEASTQMLRILFNSTAKENTSVNIEDCLDDQHFHLPSYFAALNNPEAKIHLEERI